MKKYYLSQLNEVIKKYYLLQLKFWWNYRVNKDEFHSSLDYASILNEFKNKRFDKDKILNIVICRRTIVNKLDEGTDIKEISIKLIKGAMLNWF